MFQIIRYHVGQIVLINPPVRYNYTVIHPEAYYHQLLENITNFNVYDFKKVFRTISSYENKHLHI